MVYNPATDHATIIGTYTDWHEVFVQVLTGGIRIAPTKNALETPGPGNTLQGIAINPATGVIRRLPWRGPLWIIADAPNTYADITVV